MADVGRFELASGRSLHLRELRQYLTYEGLLEGLPTAEGNERMLERLAAERRGKTYPDGPAHLIRPTERPVAYRKGERYPFGTPSALPRVTCIGRFQSFEPTNHRAGDFSGLVVIWFQEEYAFPIDPDVTRQILGIDWDGLAADIDY
jgi:hypothetical protein